MTMSESLHALRKANPRTENGFDELVASVSATVRERMASSPAPRTTESRRRLGRVSLAGAALVAAAAVVAVSTVGWPGGDRGVQNAAAAVKKAATLTSASAERSGVAVVRVTHDDQIWVGATIRWNGDDLSVSQDGPLPEGRPRPAGPRSALVVVRGTMYGVDDGQWVVLGPTQSVDPDSGTTPDEYLLGVREDVGGATLRRVVDGMTGLTTSQLADGSVVYRGLAPAGLIARETGFKEGQSIRVLPFGYVAHGKAVDPSAPLDVAVTVRDGVIRELAVSWAPGWRYTVAYSGLGATPAPEAPANAKPLRRR
jgi:hypothetical protein